MVRSEPLAQDCPKQGAGRDAVAGGGRPADRERDASLEAAASDGVSVAGRWRSFATEDRSGHAGRGRACLWQRWFHATARCRRNARERHVSGTDRMTAAAGLIRMGSSCRLHGGPVACVDASFLMSVSWMPVSWPHRLVEASSRGGDSGILGCTSRPAGHRGPPSIETAIAGRLGRRKVARVEATYGSTTESAQGVPGDQNLWLAVCRRHGSCARSRCGFRRSRVLRPEPA